MSRALTMLVAIACYAIFFATFLYLIVFVGDFSFAGRTVDVGPEAPVLTAVVVDVALIALFGVQHSVMARPAFKAGWTKIVPPQAERSVYVLAASLALIILIFGWRPIDSIVWNVRSPILGQLIWLLFWIGWATVLISTFLINHFELFGLHQVTNHLVGKQAEPPRFKTPLLYKFIRHPIYLGFIIAFWAAPTMTAGHLLFAAVTTAYIFVGIALEERDLVDLFGDEYRQYKQRVSMLIPWRKSV